MRAPRLLALGLAAIVGALALAGCAGRRITDGVYHSEHGYRVRIPGDWKVVDRTRADLELRHRDGEAGMLVNAVCDAKAARRPPAVLTSQLLAGVRERKVIERGAVSVNGRSGTRTVVEARTAGSGPRFWIDSVTLRDGRCVYDLIYAAPTEAAADHRVDFNRLLESFTTE